MLELVLRRGRSYDEIAELLSIDRAGVRQRALAALDALGPKTRVAANRRALIADYLLEALPTGVAEEVREHFKGSAGERAWARAVASELEDLSDRPLPEIPANGRSAQPRGERVKPPAKSQKRVKPRRAEVPAAAALSNGTARERPTRVSRRGGAVLLAAAAAVAIVLVLVFVVFTGSSKKHPARAASHTRTSTKAKSTSSAQILSHITLVPPDGAKSPLGVAYVVKVKNQVGMLLAAEGLKPNTKHPANYYGIWLYNSPSDDQFLGLVTPAVGKNGEFRLPASIPTNASHYHHLVVTAQTGVPKKATNGPTGPTVLEGTGTL